MLYRVAANTFHYTLPEVASVHQSSFSGAARQLWRAVAATHLMASDGKKNPAHLSLPCYNCPVIHHHCVQLYSSGGDEFITLSGG